jgi:hypothetical protein
MARVSALHNGTAEKGRDAGEAPSASISSALAEAKSTEERREIFAAYLQKEHEGEFAADCEKVAKLLQRNDVEGLIEHGARHIPEQAAARVAAIRAGK